jgi:hypothetical protein
VTELTTGSVKFEPPEDGKGSVSHEACVFEHHRVTLRMLLDVFKGLRSEKFPKIDILSHQMNNRNIYLSRKTASLLKSIQTLVRHGRGTRSDSTKSSVLIFTMHIVSKFPFSPLRQTDDSSKTRCPVL